MGVDIQAARSAAIIAAAIVHSGDADAPPERLTQYADKLIPWIAAPPTARMIVTLIIPGTSTSFTASTTGGIMADFNATVDNTTVTITVATKDDQNNPTSDAIVFTADDNGALLTPSVDATGKVWTGTLTKVEGTVNVTASDPTAPAVGAFVATIVIGAGATSQLTGTVDIA